MRENPTSSAISNTSIIQSNRTERYRVWGFAGVGAQHGRVWRLCPRRCGAYCVGGGRMRSQSLYAFTQYAIQGVSVSTAPGNKDES